MYVHVCATDAVVTSGLAMLDQLLSLAKDESFAKAGSEQRWRSSYVRLPTSHVNCFVQKNS